MLHFDESQTILGARMAGLQWTRHRVDLVVEERLFGLCAIQCDFFNPHGPEQKKVIDSFRAKSEQGYLTSRLIFNTGGCHPVQRFAGPAGLTQVVPSAGCLGTGRLGCGRRAGGPVLGL